jgi:predicted oxidoreductase
VYAGAPNLKSLLATGYVVQAPTLRELAGLIKVDAAGLEATVAKVNADAATGKDTVFHKGEHLVEQSVGDPSHQPNPCFGPVGAGPYYAIRIYPGDGSTSLGLYVDEGARVLDADNRPIPGLYAAGLDMNSIWRGRPPGNGANNGPAMTFGFIAAQSLIADG